MSLPPGFIDEIRTRVSLSAVVGRKVTWDMRKSNMGKGDWWAPCPFHQEKSASFHVDDRKGYYYCFGCHAKGDAVSFVKESDNVSFMEAVEILAREAGMTMPARDPRAAEKADHRTQLIQIMEEAVKWFRLQLRTSAAGPARDYLAKRKLSEEAQARWDIGFAPDARQALFQALQQKGFAPDMIVATGLCAKADDGSIYDRFRDRIIFPIRDARGRAISLGGRAMAADARAKYLNGPETELFDKGRNLFNFAKAREAVGKGATLIVAEGYMDVIALSEAGFTGAVAPLGTAVTEDQLRLMWRVSPSPVLALDGDVAGQRAASRVIDLALPIMESGQELLFAVLDAGKDPDDIIHTDGKARMEAIIAAAKPVSEMLWQREFEKQDRGTPERLAQLKKSLAESVNRVADARLRTFLKAHFNQKLDRLLFSLGTPKKAGKKEVTRLPSQSTKTSALATSDAWNVVETIRELAILAVLYKNPRVTKKYEFGLEVFDMLRHDHAHILSAIMKNRSVQPDQAYQTAIEDILGQDRVEALLTNTYVRVVPAMKNPDNFELASATVEEQMAFLTADRGHRREIEDGELDMEGLVDEGLTHRVNRANEALWSAARFGMESEGDANAEQTALSQHLQQLIDKQVWVKKHH
jgi:DNA primase